MRLLRETPEPLKPARATRSCWMLTADIDAQLPFQLGQVGRDLQQIVVERRPRGRGDEPVGADAPASRAAERHGDAASRGGVEEDAVGILGQQAVPEIGVPHEVAQVDAQDGLGRVDGGFGRVMRGCQDRLFISLDRALR